MRANELYNQSNVGEITEAANDEEQKFIMIMDWFNAASGMPEKHAAADRLKEKYPGIEPWKWVAGYKAFLKN